MKFYESLEFDLPAALTERLVGLFDEMPRGVLNPTTIRHVGADAQGVYQLFVDAELVYIGKTDADAGLGKRLLRHASKVAGRKNLDCKSVSFKAIRVYVFTVMDLEQLLIAHYKKVIGTNRSGEKALAWNNSGFGSNDPGRERDTSEVKADHFDAQFPIDLDHTITVPDAGTATSIAVVLAHLKGALPYLLRYQSAVGKRGPHADLVSTYVTISKRTDTVRSVLKQIAVALGSKWQVTALPGYIILYKEKKGRYKHAVSL